MALSDPLPFVHLISLGSCTVIALGSRSADTPVVPASIAAASASRDRRPSQDIGMRSMRSPISILRIVPHRLTGEAGRPRSSGGAGQVGRAGRARTVGLVLERPAL